MKRIVLYPFKAMSKSALRLLENLQENGVDATLVMRDSKYTPQPNDVIVGWGSGNRPSWDTNARGIWLNKWSRIEFAVNKQATFDILSAAGIPIPPRTVNLRIAEAWSAAGHVIIMRDELEGKDGSGIEVVTKPAQLREASLYTRFMPRDEEYRVHVGNLKAFWGQERAPISDKSSKYYKAAPNDYVRTTSNGWELLVYHKNMPKLCKDVAIRAIDALGLDFGAVDIGWKAATANSPESVCVYEVNTAPELSERTCSAYVNMLMETTK